MVSVISALNLRTINAFAYRYPLTVPVVTSFGRMSDRPAVFVRIEDADGAVGWGEVWANFPSTGAEHRARIVNEILGPLLLQSAWDTPQCAFEQLTLRTSVLALQSGEPGPFAQCVAGIDLALWDLVARRENKPLWQLLGGDSPVIKVYASGINPTGSLPQAEMALDRGHRALKIKIGFDAAHDQLNLSALRDLVGAEGMLAADANQAWTLSESIRALPISRTMILPGSKSRSGPTARGTNGKSFESPAHHRWLPEKTLRAETLSPQLSRIARWP